MADCSTSKSTEKQEPKEQRVQKIRKDGGSRGSSRSSSRSASRESTPKPLPKRPKNQYTRETLIELRLSPLCKKRPFRVEELVDCDLPDVVRDEPIGLEDISTSRCEPEMWYKHIRHLQEHDSRGNSPLTVGGAERKRYNEAGGDSDTAYKRRGADMRGGKEEEDETGGIILGPQRKSFGTGCYVTTNFSRRNDSPKENDREGLRTRGRIGSGRITVDHERERVSDRSSYRDRDRDMREPPRRFERGDSRGNFGSERGGFEKDKYQRTRDYEMRDDGRDDRRDRDYNDRRYDNRRGYNRNDHGSNHAAPEPEWFTSGPISQSDTIELVGFDNQREDRNSPTDVVEDRQHNYRDNHRMGDSHMEESIEQQNKDTCVSVADRNGSLETNESSSPEHSQNSDDDHHNHHHGGHGGAMNDRRHLRMEAAGSKDISTGGGGGGAGGESFDLNDIFIKNIPGLSDLIGSIDREVPTPTEGVGSRFSQWFQPGSRASTSRENSRRSSINEDFSYLHDLLNGSKSPVIPSPPLASQHMAMYHHHPPPGTAAAHFSLEAAKQHHNLIELLGSKGMLPPQQQLQQNQINLYHAQHSRTVTSVATQQGAVSVSDVEASLKALLLPGSKSTNSEQNSIKNIPNLVPPGGKFLTAEELEATLTGLSPAKPPPQTTAEHIGGDSSGGVTHGGVVSIGGGGGGPLAPDNGSVFSDLPRKIRGQGIRDHKVVEQTTKVRGSGFGHQSESPNYHQQHVFRDAVNSGDDINSSSSSARNTSSMFSGGPDIEQGIISHNNPPGLMDRYRDTSDQGGYGGSSSYAYHHPHGLTSSSAYMGGDQVLVGSIPAHGRHIYSACLGTSHPEQTMSAELQTSSSSSSTNTSNTYLGVTQETSRVLDGGPNADFLPRRPSIENSSFTQSPTVIQGGAKVTTVAELEEELGRSNLGNRAGGKMVMTGQTQGGGGGGSRHTPEGTMGRVTPQQRQQQDMAAFNKLLGMVKYAGENTDPSQAMQQQQAMNVHQMQKESLSRRDMIQKIVQQQQQAKAQQAAAVKQLQQQAQQQQVKQMQQKQQQQLQMLKQLMGKHNVTSGKSPIPPGAASGPPPPMNLQPPQPSVSPRCPSPMLQPPVSPRAPSPIMFGSQPPMHLTAPSPIHASPVVPGSSNTLQVSQASAVNPALARVPSPQELIVHTQAIMQNALIKRQLEEQKERFLKRQQAKSPNPANISSSASPAVLTSISGAQNQPQQQAPTAPVYSTAQSQPTEESSSKQASESPHTPQVETSVQGGNTSVTSNMTSTPASTKAAVNPAFTPTSVIRKMVTEKAEEKEIKQINDNKRVLDKSPMLRISKEQEYDNKGVGAEEGHISIHVPDINNQQMDPTQPVSAHSLIQHHLQQQQQQMANNTNHSARHVVVQGLINIPPPGPQQQLFHQQQPSVGPGHGTPAVHPAGMIGPGGMPGNPIQPGGPGPALPGPMMAGPSVVTASTAVSQSGRPIMKGNSPGTNPLSPPGPKQFIAGQQTASNPSQRPIIGCTNQQQLVNQSPQVTVDTMRFLEQQRQLQAAQAAQLAGVPVPRGRPITGRRAASGTTPTSSHTAATAVMSSHPSVNPVVANQAMLMQKMMLPGASPAAVQQIQQLAALQAQLMQPQPQQQQQQHQQRVGILDPRLASSQGPPPPHGGRPIFGMSAPGANSLGMRGMQGQPEFPGMNSAAGSRPMMTGSGGAANHEGNLAKFFGNDLLKQQVNAMPPLPNQSSQRVLTLEEIERRQQMVTN